MDEVDRATSVARHAVSASCARAPLTSFPVSPSVPRRAPLDGTLRSLKVHNPPYHSRVVAFIALAFALMSVISFPLVICLLVLSHLCNLLLTCLWI